MLTIAHALVALAAVLGPIALAVVPAIVYRLRLDRTTG